MQANHYMVHIVDSTRKEDLLVSVKVQRQLPNAAIYMFKSSKHRYPPADHITT